MEMSWERLARSTLFQEFVKKTPSTDEHLSELRGIVSRAVSDAEAILPRYSETHREYTLHDSTHSVKVVELMGLIIPRVTLKELNALELGMLILSSYLHDIGMVVSLEERENALKSEEFSDFKADFPEIVTSLQEAVEKGDNRIATQLEDYLLSVYFRKQHHVRSKIFVVNSYGNKNGMEYHGVNFAADVALLCESHYSPSYALTEVVPHEGGFIERFRRDKPIHNIRVNLQYLAVCLRLADLLDFDRERTPDVLFKYIKPRSEVSIEEWNKHRAITGWKIEPNEIRYEATCTHPLYQHVLYGFLDMIDNELFHCSYIVKDNRVDISEKYKLFLPTKTDRRYVISKDFIYGPFQFSLDFEEILVLLMGEQLYSTSSIKVASSVAVRELLQNAIDACKHRQAIERALGTKDYRPLISFAESTDSEGRPVLAIEDNGVGMNRYVLENCFMKIGKSYYRSNEFEKERGQFKKLGVDFEPSAQFGIGVMSYFLIADHLEIDTLRTNLKKTAEIPLRIKIEGANKFFVVRQGERERPGTRVTLHLKERIPWQDWLREYAVHVVFPIRLGISRTLHPLRYNTDAYLQREIVSMLTENQLLMTYEIDLSKDAVARKQGLRGRIHVYFARGLDDLPCFRNNHITISSRRMHLRMARGKPKRFRVDKGLVSFDGIRITHRRLLALKIPHSYDIDMSGSLRPDVNVTKDGFVSSKKTEEFKKRIGEIIASHMLADIGRGHFFAKGVKLIEFLREMSSSNSFELFQRLMCDKQLISERLVYDTVLESKSVPLTLPEIVSKYGGRVFAFWPSYTQRDFPGRLILPHAAFPNSVLLNIGELTVHTSEDVLGPYLEVKLSPTEFLPPQKVRFARYEGPDRRLLYIKNMAFALNKDHTLSEIYIALRSKSPESSTTANFENLLKRLTRLQGDASKGSVRHGFNKLEKEFRELRHEISKTKLLTKTQLRNLRISLKDFG